MKKLSSIVSAALLLFAPFTLADSTKIVIKGSDTLGAKMVPQLKEAYLASTGKQLSIEIAAEGSSVAFTALGNGTADIGMSSRPAKSVEENRFLAAGRELVDHVAAFDMIAVVVHQDNPVKRLRREQIEKIFTGDINNWSQVGGNNAPIAIYTRNTASGTYKSFQKLAMNKRDYAASSQKLAGNEQIATEVANNPNGIGYVGLAYASKPKLVSIRIDGVRPTPSKIDRYPLARKLHYYTAGAPLGEVKAFLDWCCHSEEAASIIRKVGFIPTADTQ